MEKWKKQKKTVILLGIVLLTVFCLNCFSIMAADEHNYSFVVGTENQRVNSLSDIKTSLSNMYQSWTGRILVHGIISFFLYVGTFLYNILNPIVLIIFLLLLSKIATGKINFYAIAISLICFVWGIPSFGENFIWLSGSLNYLWPVCMMLALILLYKIYVIEDKPLATWQKLIMLPLAFLVGFSQENTAFVMGMFFILVAITQVKKFWKWETKKKILSLTTIIAFGLGALLLIFAPGNFARLTTTGGMHISFALIFQNFMGILKIILAYGLSLILVFMFRAKTKKPIAHILKKQFILFLIPMGIAILPMAVLAEFPPRAMLPYTVFLVIALLINISYLRQVEKWMKKAIEVASLLVAIMSTYLLSYNAFLAYKYVEPIKQEIAFQVAIAKHEGEEEVIVPAFTQYQKIQRDGIVLGFFPETIENGMNNFYMAKYYGVKKIEAVQEGFVIIEVEISGEEIANEYNVIDKETQEVVGKRIVRAVNAIGPDMINRMIYTIPKEKLGQYVLDVPKEVKSTITKAVVKDFSGVKPIDIEKTVN